MLKVDITIIGAGASGITAAIFAAKKLKDKNKQILILDGMENAGNKLLICGGGRCNVTNANLDINNFNGGSKYIIRNALKAFDEKKTIDWLKGIGVELKLETDGKYFPITDKSKTILTALLNKLNKTNIKILYKTKVSDIKIQDNMFLLSTIKQNIKILSKCLIIATGGKSYPQTGSDGSGLQLIKKLGLNIIPTTPALCPLILKPNTTIGGGFAKFSGISMIAQVMLFNSKGACLHKTIGSLIFTHFGISGPAVLNFSRHLFRTKLEHPEENFSVKIGSPKFDSLNDVNKWLLNEIKSKPKKKAYILLSNIFPERIAKDLCNNLNSLGDIKKDDRNRLAEQIYGFTIEVISDINYESAEVTAGGVDLSEINYRSMETKKVKNLFLCGEILDVDGNVGGYNLQWAWSSGYLAGISAANSLLC